jgi:hypothetical protein
MMRSRNGGGNWEALSGEAISLPVDTDNGLATMINDSAEINHSTFLWTIRVKEGKIHLPYYVGENALQRYVRFDTVTGQKDVNLTGWSGGTLDVKSGDGFCTASNNADHTVYCVSRMGDRLAVLVSDDNGLTWRDHSVTEPLGINPYGITGAREVRDGHIVGMFTLEQGTNKTVHFFRIPVTTPATQRLHAVAVTTQHGALAGYPATNAIDGNPQTLWVDPSPNNNSWIKIDLGTVQQINRVRFHSGLGTPYPAYAPGDYTISVSQDDVNWTTVVTRTNLLNHINGDDPVGMTGRFVKLTTTTVNGGSGWALSFHEFWAEGPAPTPTRLPATTGGVQTPGYETGKANDGRYDTQFVHSLTPAPQNNIATFELYFGIDYRHVTRVKWVAATGTPYPAAAPRDFVIQTSDYGFNWTTVASRSAPDFTGSISAGSIPINRSVRFVRILTSTVWDGTGWSLGLLEFWAEGW